MSARDTPESGQLPGRYLFAREPKPMGVPTNPEWHRFSDVIRSFSASAGASYERQDSVGTADAVDHFRGVEDPSLDISYDMYRFPVDANGNPVGPEADGILRDEYNQLPNTQLIVERQETTGGNDSAGVRVYTVARGCAVESVDATLDPSAAEPILLELSYMPRKVRSYKIHQPSAGTTLDIVSTSDNDTMDITIEDEGASTAETIALNGTTTVTTTASFSDIDAVWLADNPEGDVTVTDGGGTTLAEVDGGLAYSDDDQPIDGDRGVPPLRGGSIEGQIGGPAEFFEGDRFERPSGEAVRARVNSASWSVENDLESNPLHSTRAQSVDAGNRTVTIDADTAGPFVSHDSMMEALTKVQQDLEHELSGGIFRFRNTLPEDSAERTREADQSVASFSETLAASGSPPIELDAK